MCPQRASGGLWRPLAGNCARLQLPGLRQRKPHRAAARSVAPPGIANPVGGLYVRRVQWVAALGYGNDLVQNKRERVRPGASGPRVYDHPEAVINRAAANGAGFAPGFYPGAKFVTGGSVRAARVRPGHPGPRPGGRLGIPGPAKRNGAGVRARPLVFDAISITRAGRACNETACKTWNKKRGRQPPSSVSIRPPPPITPPGCGQLYHNILRARAMGLYLHKPDATPGMLRAPEGRASFPVAARPRAKRARPRSPRAPPEGPRSPGAGGRATILKTRRGAA